MSLVVVVHILNNKVRCAEIDESSTRVSVSEEWREQLNKFFFTIVIKDEILLVFDQRVPLVEGFIAELLNHLSFKSLEIRC